jgi:hypothetical protein
MDATVTAGLRRSLRREQLHVDGPSPTPARRGPAGARPGAGASKRGGRQIQPAGAAQARVQLPGWARRPGWAHVSLQSWERAPPRPPQSWPWIWACATSPPPLWLHPVRFRHPPMAAAPARHLAAAFTAAAAHQRVAFRRVQVRAPVSAFLPSPTALPRSPGRERRRHGRVAPCAALAAGSFGEVPPRRDLGAGAGSWASSIRAAGLPRPWIRAAGPPRPRHRPSPASLVGALLSRSPTPPAFVRGSLECRRSASSRWTSPPRGRPFPAARRRGRPSPHAGQALPFRPFRPTPPLPWLHACRLTGRGRPPSPASQAAATGSPRPCVCVARSASMRARADVLSLVSITSTSSTK